MRDWFIEVRKAGFMDYAVVGVVVNPENGEVTTEDVIEHGHFTRTTAEKAKAAWERDAVNAEVAQAEKKAGWDARP